MFTLWAITADSDAHVTENIKTRAAAIRAAREAQASGLYDCIYIEVGNGEDIITNF